MDARPVGAQLAGEGCDRPRRRGRRGRRRSRPVRGRGAGRRRAGSGRAARSRTASSNAPAGVSPPRNQSAAEWPPTAQKRCGNRRARSSAPKPPIEMPPTATRRGSAFERRSASGSASRDDRRAPRAVAAVVPVAVIAAVGEQHDRRAGAEIVEPVEELLVQVRAGRRAASVQEDEQLAAARAAGRQDEDLVQVAVDEPALQREADDPRAARAPVAAPPVANADPAADQEHGGQRDDQAAPQGPAASTPAPILTAPRYVARCRTPAPTCPDRTSSALTVPDTVKTRNGFRSEIVS